MQVADAGSLTPGSGETEADGGLAWPARALLQLCGCDRRVWAALRGHAACWSGGYHGMAVWPGPGKLGSVLLVLVLYGLTWLV